MFYRSLGGLALAVALPFASAAPAFAQVATIVSGIVTSGGAPVSGASVTLSGNNLTLRTASDARGAFAFTAVALGEYVVRAAKGDLSAVAPLEAGSGGARVSLALESLQEIGNVRASGSTAPAARSGADATFGHAILTRSAYARSLPSMLLQVSSAARGSNGQVHINGDHGDIAYVVDGVPVPQELSRVLGTEFDPTNVSYAEVIEGAFPAQYGDRFAAVVNLATRSGSGSAGSSLEAAGASFGTLDSELVYHAPIGRGGLIVSSRLERDGRALDAPVADPVHDAGSTSTQFARYSLPFGRGDSLNLDLDHSYQTFQLPPDTANGQPATQDDNETQSDIFGSLQWRHAIGERGFFSVAPSFKRSTIRDFNDLAADLAPAAGNDCSANPGDCVFSAAADRTSTSFGLASDYGTFGERHSIRAGASYRVDAIAKRYDIALQPDNFIRPGPLEIVDDAPNVAHSQAIYVQDTWKFGGGWQADYGLRQDAFQLSSTDFAVGYAQLSPRVKVTRTFSPRASVYGYYGRLFVPFGFENIGLASSQFLDPASGTTFDLKPARDSLYELGAHIPVGGWDVGIRLAHYVRTDVLDDAQIGTTNIHQDVNFAQGRFDAQSLLVSRTWGGYGSRAYFTITHGLAVNRGCGSSLLIDCGRFPDGYVPADHDQRVSAAAGLYLPSSRGWISLDAEYGSGLSSSECDFCKVPSHLTFDADVARALAKDVSLELVARNLFDDRYAITLGSSLQGTHYARPRSLELRLAIGK
ncbi:MAG TPA: TonB-dependent receptor [Candidatus Baltobacteraceae bacterium]|jgi:hypothetical protein